MILLNLLAILTGKQKLASGKEVLKKHLRNIESQTSSLDISDSKPKFRSYEFSGEMNTQQISHDQFMESNNFWLVEIWDVIIFPNNQCFFLEVDALFRIGSSDQKPPQGAEKWRSEVMDQLSQREHELDKSLLVGLVGMAGFVVGSWKLWAKWLLGKGRKWFGGWMCFFFLRMGWRWWEVWVGDGKFQKRENFLPETCEHWSFFWVYDHRYYGN